MSNLVILLSMYNYKDGLATSDDYNKNGISSLVRRVKLYGDRERYTMVPEMIERHGTVENII